MPWEVSTCGYPLTVIRFAFGLALIWILPISPSRTIPTQVGINVVSDGIAMQPKAAPLYFARGVLYIQLAEYEKGQADLGEGLRAGSHPVAQCGCSGTGGGAGE